MNLNFLHTILLLGLIIRVSTQERFLQEQTKCYGLALEGGGDKAAWQVGALKTMLKQQNVQYDVLTGVSAGSLNTAFMSIYSKDQEAQSIEDLEKMWLSINSQSIYKKPNYISEAYNILFKKGILDNSPLQELLKKTLNGKKIQRPTTSGVTDLTNGNYLTYDIDKMEQNAAIEAVISSTSIPGIFPYRVDDNKVLVDGGVMYMVDIQSIVRRCQELGFNEENVVIDVLLCNEEKKLATFPVEKKNYNTVDVLQRYFQVNNFIKSVDEVAEAMIKFPQAKFRNVFRPSLSLTGWRIPLKFDLDLTKQMIALGEQDVLKKIQNGELIDSSIIQKLEEKYSKMQKIKNVLDRIRQ